jgi:hypothetical protein
MAVTNTTRRMAKMMPVPSYHPCKQKSYSNPPAVRLQLQPRAWALSFSEERHVFNRAFRKGEVNRIFRKGYLTDPQDGLENRPEDKDRILGTHTQE